MTKQEAFDLGASAGLAEVRALLRREGLAAVRSAMVTRRARWADHARATGVAIAARVPSELREVYYGAYGDTAQEFAEDLSALD